MTDKEDKNVAKFKSYPTRGITLADEVWKELKRQKQEYGGNWNKFIEQLINKNK